MVAIIKKSALVGVLSAAALVVSAADASAGTWTNQMGSVGYGCWASENVSAYGAGHHVSGGIYEQQPGGLSIACDVELIQYYNGVVTSDTGLIQTLGPGDYEGTPAWYYGPAGGGNWLCVKVVWEMDRRSTPLTGYDYRC